MDPFGRKQSIDMKKSIFVYIGGYLPGKRYGGPVTSIYNFTEHFGDQYDIYIVCSDHDFRESTVYDNRQSGWNRVGKAQVLYMPESAYSAGYFKELMEDKNVCMVYLSGVFSYQLNHAAIKAARALGIKTVTATRGEICVNVLAMKRWKKLPYLAIMKTIGEFKGCYFQVTSEEERTQLERYLSVPADHIIYLPNIHGTSMDIERPTKASGSANMIFISRVHPKKNLLDALKAAVLVQGDLHFDIYGPIEDDAYWEECKKVIETAPENVKITYCGQLDTTAARQSYYGYHAFVFPTLTENYGHVIVESMIADCPIIISRGTTPWDDADNQAGYVVDLHNIPALASAMDRIIDMTANEFEALQGTLRSYRDSKLQLQKLLNGYRSMIEDDIIESVSM